MATKRADWLILKKSKFTADEILRCCKCSLFHVSDALKPITDNFTIGELYEDFKNINDFMLSSFGDEFMFLLENSEDLNIGYYRFSIVEQHLYMAILFGKDTNSGACAYTKNVSSVFQLSSSGVSSHKDSTSSIAATNFVVAVFKRLVMLVKTAMESSMFPIAHYTANPPANAKGHRPHIAHDKKPWMRGDLVSIKFLDALPHPARKVESKGGSHASPRFHKRKGHYRTMRAEIFKGHKDFGKPRWIAPTWVGDREAEVGGVTYKVLGV